MAQAIGLDRPPSFIARMLAEARLEEDIDRQKEWADRWNAYMGRKDDVLEVKDDDPDDNVLVPYEQLLVNKGRSFLFGKGDIKFEIQQDEVEGKGLDTTKGSRKTADGSSTAQKWLDECWRRNWKKTLLLKYATNGGVFGHGYMKIVNEAPFPRLVNLDPATVTAFYADDDIEKVEAYEIIYNTTDDDGEEIVHKEVIEREELEDIEPEPQQQTTARAENPADTEPTPQPQDREGKASSRPPGAPEPPDPAVNLAPIPQKRVQWVITHYEADHDNDDWVKVDGPDIWPFEWAPVIDNQHLPVPNEYLGMSDIELAQMKLAKAIDRMLSDIRRIIRLHAHPFLYTVGLTPQEVRQMELFLDPDSITNLPNPDADLRSLEMQSDLGSSIEYYKRVKEVWHEVTRLPEVATGKVENAGPLSGVALDILYGPLMEATDDKRCTYGDMLIELNRRLLDLGGFGYGMWINIVWPETMPKDLQAEGAVLLQDKQLGASEHTLLEKRGYDPEKEKEMRRQEAEENMKLNMQSMQAEQAVAGEEGGGGDKPFGAKEATDAAKDKQAEEAGRGSTPGPTGFGRNAKR